MLKIGTETKLTPAQVMKKAISFFGPDGLKMKITGQTETEISFEEGEGFVTMAAGVKKGKTAVEFTTREWEKQVEQFIMMIH
jgi:hypothetical protein